MKNICFYDAVTGIFKPSRMVLLDDEAIAANTPEGTLPMEGMFNHTTQRVDIATGEVVVYTPPPLSDERVAERVRNQRNALIVSSDWVVLRATEQGGPVPDVWRAYRQALRDVPDQPGFPNGVVWPASP